ncbi:hypothetical protein K2X92_06280 [Candidatus Gracilibacteria bacterium]|nr:hypothetical protein [Candidatus Gracilibacteria bacterium]
MTTPNTNEPIRLETNSRGQTGISLKQAELVGNTVALLLMRKPLQNSKNQLH